MTDNSRCDSSAERADNGGRTERDVNNDLAVKWFLLTVWRREAGSIESSEGIDLLQMSSVTGDSKRALCSLGFQLQKL